MVIMHLIQFYCKPLLLHASSSVECFNMTRGVVRFRSYVARGDVFIGKSLRLAQMKLGLLSLAYSSCYWLVCVRH